MSMNAINHLDRELATSRFKFGDYISDGYELWKKGYWAFFGFSLLYMVISGIVGQIPYVGELVNQLVISPVLTAGAYMYCHNLQRDKEADFETFFSQFTGNAQLFLVYIIYTLVLFLAFVPFLLALGLNILDISNYANAEVLINDFDGFNWSALPLLLIPFFATLLLTYGLHFVIFYKLSAVDAVTYSFKFCIKHVFLLLAFLFIGMLIMASGILGFGIGLFFTWHVMWPLSYESFRQFTNLTLYEKGDEQQDTIDHLIA